MQVLSQEPETALFPSVVMETAVIPESTRSSFAKTVSPKSFWSIVDFGFQVGRLNILRKKIGFLFLTLLAVAISPTGPFAA